MDDDGEGVIVVFFLIVTRYEAEREGEDQHPDHEQGLDTRHEQDEVSQAESDSTDQHRQAYPSAEQINTFVGERLQVVLQEATEQRISMLDRAESRLQI